MCTNGTQVPCEVPSLPNPTTRKGWPHHRGLRPLLFSNSDVGSFTSHNNKKGKVLWTGPTVFRPYPRRLESLTICRYVITKAALSSQLLKNPECWSGRDLNPRLAPSQLSQPDLLRISRFLGEIPAGATKICLQQQISHNSLHCLYLTPPFLGVTKR